MPRLFLTLDRGAQAATVQSAAQQLGFVQDAVTARQAGAVIVTVDEITSSIRQQLAEQPGVDAVFEDIQAIPAVVTEEVEDFLRRVRASRGESEAPLLVETEPTRANDLRTDGGQMAAGPSIPSRLVRPATPPTPQGAIAGINDSLRVTGASAVQSTGLTGVGVNAVIVDTGSPAAFVGSSRRLDGIDLTDDDDPWSLFSPHGGMTTGIMAGGPSTPGISHGFAPDADVFPVKTTLAASELALAQDAIVNLAEETGRPTVVNNSWGFLECSGLCNHPVTRAIDSANQHSLVYQAFAAGNQGGEAITACGGACDGSTPGISGPNSLDSGLTVAATGLDGVATQLQPYSSRGGPGSVSCGSRKPEVSAPIFGTVPWGTGSRNIGNGGGTSGACPQVAGSLALLLSESTRTQARATRSLTQTADQIDGSGFNGCSGFGNLRADRAIEAAPIVGAGLSDTRRVAAAGIAAGVIGAVLRRRFAG